MSLKLVVAEDEAIIRIDLVELLIVLDIKMPGLDGIAATSKITDMQTTAILILSAFSQQDLIDQAQSAGAQGYLVKPFHKSELVPAIETAYARFKEKHFLDSIGDEDPASIKKC